MGERARKKGLEEIFQSVEEVDQAFRPQILAPVAEEDTSDIAPSAPLEDGEARWRENERKKLSHFLRNARHLAGPESDRKLAAAAQAIEKLLAEGYRPIVFCRFIPTAEYLEAWLPQLLRPRFPDLQVKAATGKIGDEERRARVDELAQDKLRVLVATDCLSEGINLQDHFDAGYCPGSPPGSDSSR